MEAEVRAESLDRLYCLGDERPTGASYRKDAGGGTLARTNRVSTDSKTDRHSTREISQTQPPDGLYMYDGFRAEFVLVYQSHIHGGQAAIRKYGAPKLNNSFTAQKKYKKILGGQKIAEIHNVEILKNGEFIYDEQATEIVREGPAYRIERPDVDTMGSAARPVIVPEQYGEVGTKFALAISEDEVARISKLASDKLFRLVMKRKELTQYAIKEKELDERQMVLLDKICRAGEEMYIGIYTYVFRTANAGILEFDAVFSAGQDDIRIITTQYDDETLRCGMMKICGMVDIERGGKEELIIEKEFGGHDETTTNLEIYKQEMDGSWSRVKNIRTRR